MAKEESKIPEFEADSEASRSWVLFYSAVSGAIISDPRATQFDAEATAKIADAMLLQWRKRRTVPAW